MKPKLPPGPNWKTCPSCGVRLWKWIDGNRVKILGNNGQDYEIGFTFIDLNCSKCGQRTTTSSEIMESIEEIYLETNREKVSLNCSIYETNPYFALSNDIRKKVLKKLSGPDIQVLTLLTEEVGKSGNMVDILAQKLNLSTDEVGERIHAIDKEIENIKPNFKIRKVEVHTNNSRGDQHLDEKTPKS